MTIACVPGRLRREHTKHPAELSGTWGRPLTLLRAICTALPEAFLAFRRYERSRSMSVPHDVAIRDALAVGPERDCGQYAGVAIRATGQGGGDAPVAKGHRHVEPPARRQGITPPCPAKAE